MAYLQIREVPDDVRDVLAEQARSRGQSLNRYLRDIVVREAAFAANRDLVDSVARRSRPTGVTTEDVLAALDDGRAQASE